MIVVENKTRWNTDDLRVLIFAALREAGIEGPGRKKEIIRILQLAPPRAGCRALDRPSGLEGEAVAVLGERPRRRRSEASPILATLTTKRADGAAS